MGCDKDIQRTDVRKESLPADSSHDTIHLGNKELDVSHMVLLLEL